MISYLENHLVSVGIVSVAEICHIVGDAAEESRSLLGFSVVAHLSLL
jgi:hypothetical protein